MTAPSRLALLRSWFAATLFGPGARRLGAVALVFLVCRGLLALSLLLGGAMTRERPDRDPNITWRAFPQSFFWDGLVRWDSGWFAIVHDQGYARYPDAPRKAAFFPLYPYVVRAVAPAFGGNHWAAGLFVSNLALFAALVVLERIARPTLGPDGAQRALVYVLAFPASFFLSAYYSEGLFLFLSALTMAFYLRDRFLLCGVAGALACLTRHVGLALFAACALGLAWNVAAGRKRLTPATLGLLLMPLGTLAFMTILYVQLGDPFAFLSAHRFWGRDPLAPGSAAFFADVARIDWSLPRDMMNTITLMDAVSAVVFLALPCLLFGRFDLALPIYSILLILIPLSTGSVKSMMRCECIAFPAFLALAQLGARRDVDRAIVLGFALLLGVLSLQFANWYWVG